MCAYQVRDPGFDAQHEGKLSCMRQSLDTWWKSSLLAHQWTCIAVPGAAVRSGSSLGACVWAVGVAPWGCVHFT